MVAMATSVFAMSRVGTGSYWEGWDWHQKGYLPERRLSSMRLV